MAAETSRKIAVSLKLIFNKKRILIFLIALRRYVLFLLGSFILCSVSGVIIYAIIPPPLTPLMITRIPIQLRENEKPVFKARWVSLEDISPSLILAVVASEDNNFMHHFGIDLKALQQAREENKHRKRPRGASTITQQTAKNLFLVPSRSYIRKGFEVYFTVLIELIWSKKRIMEVYLNCIEMGKGIYGAEAAAQTYFNTSAANLSRSQSAMLAVILPNPRNRDPRHPSAYMMSRHQWVLWNMRNIEQVQF